MRSMKKYARIMTLLLSVLSLGACSSWLDIEPEGEVTSKKLFGTGDGYRTVISGIYRAMSGSNLYGVQLQFGLLDCVSQQYTWSWDYSMGSSTTNIYKEAKAYNYANTALKKAIEAIWLDGYNVVANANNLIQNLEKENGDKFAGGEMERNMIMGEAYACRALMHFDLCRMFAPAPIEKESGNYLPYVDEYPNIQPMSIDVPTFLNKVVDDLKKALELTAEFDTSPLGISVNSSANARFFGQLDYGMEGYQKERTLDDFYLGRGYRLNHYAIMALLARVYQYMGQDQQAFDYAKQLMELKALGTAGSSYDMFSNDDHGSLWTELENSNDTKVRSNLIFALYNENAYVEYGISSYFKKKVTDNNAGQWFVLDLTNQEIFNNPDTGADEREGDLRGSRQLFSPEYSSFSSNSDFISAKWYPSETEDIRKKNLQVVPVIRATEMRYIMAEHYARQGDWENAYSILNEIRMNRNLYEPLTVKNDLDGFLADMVRDAQREWISEGQLFYLYKRLGTTIKIGNEKRKMNKSEYMFPVPTNQNM